MKQRQEKPTDRRTFLGISAKALSLTALLQLGLPFRAAANAPQEVRLSYEAASKNLTVRITHGSAWPAFHYIEKVEIKKGGKTVSSTEYSSQPAQETFSYVYPVEASPGDLLEVRVSCSIFGSSTEKLTVK
ncbi:MAG: hypothetical protein AB1558_11900 [Thermodesulfobacteriota bacterium]